MSGSGARWRGAVRIALAISVVYDGASSAAPAEEKPSAAALLLPGELDIATKGAL